MWKKLREKQRNRQECTTAAAVVRILGGKFLEVHIINMLHIKRIKGFDILMENGGTIPLAQKRAVGFKAKFNDFLQSTFDKI